MKKDMFAPGFSAYLTVSAEIGLKGLRTLFAYRVMGTFFMQERALIRG